MALIHWWKLINDTNDYIGNNHMVNSGMVKTNDGKLGDTYTAQEYSHHMKTQKSISLVGSLSYACWAYISSRDSEVTSGIISMHNHNANTNIAISTSGGNVDGYKLNISIGYGDDREYSLRSAKTTIKTNTWNHIGLTFDADSKKIKLFLNGELDGEWTLTKTVEFSTNNVYLNKWSSAHQNQYLLKIKYNDVRIYDHPLSKKEIKLISQAKICHYKMNDEYETPTHNLIPVPRVNSELGANHHIGDYTWDRHVTVYTSEYMHTPIGYAKCVKTSTKYDTSLSGSGGFRICYSSDIRVTNGGTYTFSLYIRAGDNLQYMEPNLIYLRQYEDGVGQISEYGYANRDCVESLGGGWFRVYKTITLKPNTDYISLQSYVYPGKDIDYVVTGYQIEAGDKLSPFTMGKRNIGINDCSGFENHGTIPDSNHPIITMDDARFKRNTGITSGVYIKDFSSNDNYTISSWIKIESNTFHKFWGTTGYQLQLMYSTSDGLGFVYWDSSGGHSNNLRLPTNYKFDIGKYYHTAVTWDGTNLKIYINGELNSTIVGTNLTNNKISSQALKIGGSIYAWGHGIESLDGNMKDFIVYKTALSSDDIKDLYTSSTSIDKNGKLYTRNIIEDNSFDSYNLVLNGTGEYKNNTNFPACTYNINSNTFTKTGDSGFDTTNFIKVNKEDTYMLEGEFRSPNNSSPKLYFGLKTFDINKNMILHDQISHYGNTRTTLAKPLNSGDTTVEVTSSVNWKAGSVTKSSRRFGFYTRTDGAEYNRHNGAPYYTSISGNIITLENTWTGRTIPTGTCVANAYDGNSYNYMSATNVTLTNKFQKFSATITGWSEGFNTDKKFRYGTEFVKILFLMNYGGDSSQITEFRNIKFTNITTGQSIELPNLNNSINRRGITTNQINEQDTVGLITKNAHGTDWVQIFYHHNQAGTVLFSDRNEFMKCDIKNKQSILYRLEEFRKRNGQFEFLLEYQDKPNEYNRWEQKSNFTELSEVENYNPIHIDWSTNHWYGLATSSTTTGTFVDGSPYNDTWYYALGAKMKYVSGIPTTGGNFDSTPNWVKLWVRIEDINTFKLYKNGSLRTTELNEV